MAHLKKLAETIRRRRASLHYTQADVAELTGLSDRTFRSLETGEGGIAIQSWLNVLDVLGLEMNIQIKSIDNETRKDLLQ